MTGSVFIGSSLGWRRLGAAMALGMLAWAALVTIGFGGPDPFVTGFGILFGVVFLTMRREGRAGPILLVVISGVTLLLFTFSWQDLAHPESWRGFAATLTGLLLTGLGLLSGIAMLRGWEQSLTPRIGAAVVAIIAVGLVLGLGSAASLEDDLPQAGDLQVAAQDVMFVPAAIRSQAGTVNVFVANIDPFRHTFTVPALGLDFELPASTNRRLSFEAAPGVYDIICRVPGHEAMTLTLTVGG